MSADAVVRPMDSSNIGDRLKLCWGHLSDWEKLTVVNRSRRWLEETNRVFSPTTFIAYVSDAAVCMIEFLPLGLAASVNLCPCRMDAENHEVVERYVMGPEYSDHLFICCLMVRGKNQGKGVGTMLLNHFLASRVFAEHGGVLVYVMERDPSWESFIHWPAGPREFYEKRGFRQVKTLENPRGYLLSIPKK